VNGIGRYFFIFEVKMMNIWLKTAPVKSLGAKRRILGFSVGIFKEILLNFV
jgi:hypothetical protein